MKKNPGTSRRCRFVMASAFLLLAGVSWSSDNAHDQSEIAKRIDASGKVLDEVMADRDHAVPPGVIKRAQCVAVFLHWSKSPHSSARSVEKDSYLVELTMDGARRLPLPSPEAAGERSLAEKKLI